MIQATTVVSFRVCAQKAASLRDSDYKEGRTSAYACQTSAAIRNDDHDGKMDTTNWPEWHNNDS